MKLIYGLVDPRTEEIRYVGKSSNGLARPREHSRQADRGTKTYCYNWIRELHKLGLEYTIIVLETAPKNLAQAERSWIAFGKGFWDLTNLTEGGEGSSGRKFSISTLLRMSQKRKGRKLTDEHKRKISAGLRASMHERYENGKWIGWIPDNRGALRSPENRAKISASLKGNHITPEARAKISKALTRRFCGTNACYSRGCRCQKCKTAHTDYNKKYRGNKNGTLRIRDGSLRPVRRNHQI